MIALSTGMGREEIMGLRWSRVDFHNNYTSVTHQLKQIEKNGNEVVWIISPELKTSYRTISIDDNTLEMLKEHTKQQVRDQLKIVPDYEVLDLVRAITTGGVMKPTYLNTVFA